MRKVTTFEKELKNIFDKVEGLTDKKYVGRAFYANIDKDVRLKAEFVTLNTYEHYEALRLKTIKRDEGEIDVTVIHFKDVWGKKPTNNPNFSDGIYPHMWITEGNLEWYVYVPSGIDYEKMRSQVSDFVEVYKY